jgi:hypothetical protein
MTRSLSVYRWRMENKPREKTDRQSAEQKLAELAKQQGPLPPLSEAALRIFNKRKPIDENET